MFDVFFADGKKTIYSLLSTIGTHFSDGHLETNLAPFSN